MTAIQTAKEYEICRDAFYDQFTPADSPATIEQAWQMKRIADYLEALALIGVTVWKPSV